MDYGGYPGNAPEPGGPRFWVFRTGFLLDLEHGHIQIYTENRKNAKKFCPDWESY